MLQWLCGEAILVIRMNEGKYLIGEVSKITGVSKDTLHFYNKIKILVPDYVNPENGYRYYSRWNLWQLDIITMCRKMAIPLERIRQVLSSHDNTIITSLLLEYRQEALALSAYYQQAAEDIAWYQQESSRIATREMDTSVTLRQLEAETAIVGEQTGDEGAYHANLQEAAKLELQQSHTIRRKYGYVLDPQQAEKGIFHKQREYLKTGDGSYTQVKPQHLLSFPAGDYGVTLLHVKNGRADFTPMLRWIEEQGYAPLEFYAEEMGLQLFDYIEDFYCELKVRLTKIR